MLLYNKTSIFISIIVPEHQKYVDELQESRYALLNKAILGVIDINGDVDTRLERVYEINVNTTEVP